MEFEQRSVPVERIVEDDTRFKVSTGSVSAELAASIQRVGLINPPILIACSGGFRIVSGFKRIAALRQLGSSSISSRLLNPGTPVENCIWIAIADNSLQRPLNLVEQANAVGLLATFLTDSQMLADAACAVGLSVNPSMAEKLRRLAGMEDVLKTGILDGSIALPVAIQIEDMTDPVAVHDLGALLMELGLSLNRQRELLEWVVSICRRDDISISQLLASPEISNCLQDDGMDRRRKGELIRKYLKTSRYPTIQAHEKRFDEIVKRLGLEKGTFLTAAPHFENPAYSLRFEFSSARELRDKCMELEKIINSNMLAPLWDDPAGSS